MWKGAAKGAAGAAGVQKVHLKTSTSSIPCKFYAVGQCNKGDACTFSHTSGGGGALGKHVGKGEGKSKGWGDFGMAKGAKGDWGGAKGEWGAAKGGWGATKGGSNGVPCKFHAMGTCNKGWECPFMHEGAGFGKGGGKGGKFDVGFGKGYEKGYEKGFDGKSKGKGKGKKEGKSPGHLLPRTRISEAPFVGTVVEWKGKYGWIECAEAIDHEKASKHGGKLFFGIDDIAGGEAFEVGTEVSFNIWEDVSGLGADEVTPQ